MSDEELDRVAGGDVTGVALLALALVGAVKNFSGLTVFNLGDGIATLSMKHHYFFTAEEVYAHQDFLEQDGDLTDFELEMISGGVRSAGDS